jgi:hypothetical protein
MLTAYLVLSSAINWPISLDDPASVSLPRLVEHAGEVRLGYACYLMVALLIVPATAALNVRLGLKGGLAGLTLGLAVLSAIAKAIGISRWLFAMPGLAQAYVTPGSDQTTIALVFQTLDAYAGGIGEVIGVGLISGVWTLVVSVSLVSRPGLMAKWVGGFAVLMGLSLFLTIPAGFGIDLGPVLSISNFGWQFALLGIGAWSVFSSSET